MWKRRPWAPLEDDDRIDGFPGQPSQKIKERGRTERVGTGACWGSPRTWARLVPANSAQLQKENPTDGGGGLRAPRPLGQCPVGPLAAKLLSPSLSVRPSVSLPQALLGRPAGLTCLPPAAPLLCGGAAEVLAKGAAPRPRPRPPPPLATPPAAPGPAPAPPQAPLRPVQWWQRISPCGPFRHMDDDVVLHTLHVGFRPSGMVAGSGGPRGRGDAGMAPAAAPGDGEAAGAPPRPPGTHFRPRRPAGGHSKTASGVGVSSRRGPAPDRKCPQVGANSGCCVLRGPLDSPLD